MIIGSAIFLLAYNPNYLFDVGFQLSYSAVFGIVYLQSGFYNLLPKLRFWLVDQIWKITTVSIAAQAATFPLSVYYFHQFPLFFIVSNLIVIPLAWLLMYFGIFMLAVSVFMVPPTWLIWIFQSLLGLMTQSVHLVENLPHAVLQGLHWSRFDLVLITLLVYLFADAFWKKKKWALISSVAIAAFLSLKFSAEAIQNTAKQEITFYSIPKKTAIEIRLGTDAILLADSMLLQDKDAMLFFIRHNLWAGSISNTLEFELEKASSSAYHRYKNGVLDVFSHRILLYSEPIDSLKFNLNPTHIFVTRNIIPPKYLPHNCMVILQKGVNQKTVQVWKSKTENVYALAEEGALILQK